MMLRGYQHNRYVYLPYTEEYSVISSDYIRWLKLGNTKALGCI